MPPKGAHHTCQVREKIRQSNLRTWNQPSVKIRHRRTMQNIWSHHEPMERLRRTLKKVWSDPARRRRRSQQLKSLWKRPEYRQQFTGRNNARWRETVLRDGYRMRKSPSHPMATVRGYVPEHRLNIEKYLGRMLKRTEVVHHLGRKTDNRPHQLMAFANQSAHMRFEYGKNVLPQEIIFDGRQVPHR